MSETMDVKLLQSAAIETQPQNLEKDGSTELRKNDLGESGIANETTSPIATGVSEKVKPAFRDYLKARRNLSEAFLEREQRDQAAYRDAEQQYLIYMETVENALKVREKAELDALAIYKEKVDKATKDASSDYNARLKQARVQCREAILDAWKSSMDTSIQMSETFKRDGHWSYAAVSNPSKLGNTISHWKNRFLSVLKRV